MLRHACVGSLAFLLLAGCGSQQQGVPDFQQAFGAVDAPCPVSGAASRACTAHVVVVNHGGEGIGHASIVVPLRDATATASSARAASVVRCGKYIPDTPAGGAVDLTCSFTLPAGKTVASVPVLQDLDFQGTLGLSSSTGGSSGAAGFSVALIAAGAALITMGTAVIRRRRPGASIARSAPGEESVPDDHDDSDW